ncbi:hypothetical protein A4X09_0g6649 [Tilletia walkeri]|uniref:DNA replication factor Cdt1 C-terminal domain-containing protein n=1 Tax=Tilletia walkeri TaxID=117179 RepID=A0A8X7N3A8_9BASI|nr:hypothetical protein A4X09_0g6649 [Tilletia walkeri]
MSTVTQPSTSTPDPSPAAGKEQQQITLTGIIAGVPPGIGATKTLTIQSSKILEHARPITPEPSPTPHKKRRLSSNATAALVGVDPGINSDELLGTPPRSSPRTGAARSKVTKKPTEKRSGSSPSTPSSSSTGRVTISIKGTYSSPGSRSSPIFPGSSPRSSPSTGSSSSSSSTALGSTATRALSLRERIEAKEQARLKELEGLTRRHSTLFARAAGRSTTEPVPPAVRLGLADPDEAALLGPPKLPASSLGSTSSPYNAGSRSTTKSTKRTLSSSPRMKTSSNRAGSATRRQTAVLMDVLKRKSLISRLPEIADSLYMLFTQAAVAQGMAPTPRSSSSKSTTTSGEVAESSSSIPAMTATPRVPVLPLSEVLTSLTRSSRTILSRVELREALDLLIEFVPGFLEIRKVGQGGAEWATLVFGRGGAGAGVATGVEGASSETASVSQPLGLKEVRERLRLLV